MKSATAINSGGEGSLSHAWEDTGGENIWEHAVREDAEGRIVVAQGDTLTEAIRKRRRRLEQNDHSQRNRRVIRDMIRYVYVVVDASRWTRQKDPVLTPGTRLEVMVQLLQHFVVEYYDQNPLSHLGFIYTKNGEAEMLSALSSSSKTHSIALQSLSRMALSEGPMQGGEFSLQNAVEVAGRSLGHQPRHGSREIIVVTAALSTCDPGYILTETLPKLQQAKIRVSCFALTAELYICHKLAEETGGTIGVCLDKAHFHDWMQGQCVPPPALKNQLQGCEMIQMGFPTRTLSDVAEIVHASRDKTILARTAYTCPLCQAKNSDLPTDCAVCGLKLVLAPHLARSFHHLFPVSPFVECAFKLSDPAKALSGVASSKVDVVSSKVASTASVVFNNYLSQLLDDPKLLISSQDDERFCFACLRPFLAAATEITTLEKKYKPDEEIVRFQCPDCLNFFCLDCDALLHESLHNCPGCLRK